MLEVPDDIEEIGLEDVDLSSEVEMDVEEISLDDETATDGNQPEGVISSPEETSLDDLEGDEGILEEVEEEVPAGKRYNVFLSKISDSAKRVKAAGLLSKVKGCSPGEAKELATRLVIPLAKGVSKKKAEDVLGQFKKLKVFGRMTEVK
jgi:ribosomal protein L7/L12